MSLENQRNKVPSAEYLAACDSSPVDGFAPLGIDLMAIVRELEKK